MVTRAPVRGNKLLKTTINTEVLELTIKQRIVNSGITLYKLELA